MKKIIRKANLSGFSEVKENLKYWLSLSPEERISAVESLRRQSYGVSERLQRVSKIIKRI